MMTQTERLIGEIREKCRAIAEPLRYLKGVGGTLPDLPGDIVLLQRNRDYPINRTPQPMQLLHRCYVLTVSLQEEGLVCAAEHTCRIPEGGATLVYPFQGHHYVVEQENFFWLVATFHMENAFLPDLMLRSFELSPFAWRLTARMVELYLELLAGSAERVREGLLQTTLYALLLELRLGRCGEEGRPGGALPPRQHRRNCRSRAFGCRIVGRVRHFDSVDVSPVSLAGRLQSRRIYPDAPDQAGDQTPECEQYADCGGRRGVRFHLAGGFQPLLPQGGRLLSERVSAETSRLTGTARDAAGPRVASFAMMRN